MVGDCASDDIRPTGPISLCAGIYVIIKFVTCLKCFSPVDLTNL